jgi:hypothetical protein
MGTIDAFNILLDKPSAIFTVGETCSGRVYLKIKERLKINSFSMRFWGCADVHWTESRGSGKRRRTVHYRSHEDYIDVNTVFVGKKLNQDCYLEVGEYNYPFSVVIPVTCPTSLETFHGKIRYVLTGTVDIPWAFDKHITRTITVLSPVDLNLIPGLLQAVSVVETKKFGCCCFESSDPCEGHLSVSKGGYVSGEVLNFGAKVNNKSERKIRMRVKLWQNATLKTSSKSRTFSTDIGGFSFYKEIDSNSSEVWNSNFQIPPVCPSLNFLCRIIDVNYSVNIELDASGCASSLDVKVPILIGTIPLRQANNNAGFTYERFKIDSNQPSSQNVNDDDKPKGEIVNLDENYTPSYPYFKDFSVRI